MSLNPFLSFAQRHHGSKNWVIPARINDFPRPGIHTYSFSNYLSVSGRNMQMVFSISLPLDSFWRLPAAEKLIPQRGGKCKTNQNTSFCLRRSLPKKKNKTNKQKKNVGRNYRAISRRDENPARMNVNVQTSWASLGGRGSRWITCINKATAANTAGWGLSSVHVLVIVLHVCRVCASSTVDRHCRSG